MNKCDLCENEGFRNLNKMFLCVACYRANLSGRTSNRGKIIKARNSMPTRTFNPNRGG